MEFATELLNLLLNFLEPLSNYVYENVSVYFFIVDLVPERLECYLSILFCTHTLSEGYGFWLTFSFCCITIAILMVLLENFILTLSRFTWFKVSLNSLVSTFYNSLLLVVVFSMCWVGWKLFGLFTTWLAVSFLLLNMLLIFVALLMLLWYLWYSV